MTTITAPAASSSSTTPTGSSWLGSQARPLFNDWFGWNSKFGFPGIHPNGKIDFQW
jgi:hypothetical protein